MSIWRRASASMAWPMKRIELTFLISQRVPSFPPGLPHRDVDVGAQVALLHVAVAGAEVAQDGSELGDVGLGLPGRAQVRLGDDLHQRHAGAVEVDVGVLGMLIVQRLAGVLLQMQPLDADLQPLAACPGPRSGVGVDLHHALADDRPLVLRDLIALRQVGIEVVLAVEHGDEIDLGVEPEARAHGLRHASLVDHRQHARHGRIDERDVACWARRRTRWRRPRTAWTWWRPGRAPPGRSPPPSRRSHPGSGWWRRFWHRSA